MGTLLAVAGDAGLARAACEDVLLRLDANGAVIAGSRQSLIEHVNGGGGVQVGWQLDWNVDGHVDIAHWAPASFLSVFEDEVFAQFHDIHRQIPKPGEARVDLAEAEQAARWSGVLGSDGVLQGVFDDGEVRRWSVPSEWCAITGAPETEASASVQSCVPLWTEQYRNTPDGATQRGTRQALLRALRRGDSLRVAWGGAYADGSYSVEHVAEPVFFSIVGGEHVVVQLPEHIGQTTYVRLDDAVFSDQPQVMWRGLLRTDGVFDAVWVDRASGQIVRRLPQRAAISWLTLSPPAACDSRPPLELAEPGGVIPDTKRAAERIPK